MTLDDVLASLFPSGHQVEPGPSGTLHGPATVEGYGKVTVVGIVGGTPLGVDAAIVLAGHVLAAVERGDRAPIIFLADTSSQNMARRDELLGLNEYLAHLVKSLALAAALGHRTVSLLFGQAAAGAFIAAALSSQSLVALPGAEPSVMDLPSISRVTKLPLEQLERLAKSTPIFFAWRNAAFCNRCGNAGLGSRPAVRSASCRPSAACGHFRPPRPDRARTQGPPPGPKDYRAGCRRGCRALREVRQALSRPWRRHDLVYVASDVWTSTLAFHAPFADLPLLAEWADRGWPAIVRRRGEGDDRHQVPIGVPLPPLAGKRRVSLLISARRRPAKLVAALTACNGRGC